MYVFHTTTKKGELLAIERVRKNEQHSLCFYDAKPKNPYNAADLGQLLYRCSEQHLTDLFLKAFSSHLSREQINIQLTKKLCLDGYTLEDILLWVKGCQKIDQKMNQIINLQRSSKPSTPDDKDN